MENAKHYELMTRIAVFETKVDGKFDTIIDHLARLNGQTAKNSGAIEQLQAQDRDILSMVASQNQQDKQVNKREAEREERLDSMKQRWVDLLFKNLQLALPIFVFALLWYGRDIIKLLNI